MKGPTTRQRLERKISFLVCLYIFAIRISLLILFTFFWRLSAFFHPHFPIRFRHPQVSGARFTDTALDTVNSEQCFDARIAG